MMLYEGNIIVNHNDYVDDIGLQNLSHFLCSLENILPVVDKPSESIYYFEFSHDRLAGATVDELKFPDIVQSYFPMTVAHFFTTALSDDIFELFEEACYSSLASLSHDQVKRCYHNMLYLFTCLNNV